MSFAAEAAFDALNDDREEQAKEFKMPLITTIEDHAATAPTLALYHVELQAEYIVVVSLL